MTSGDLQKILTTPARLDILSRAGCKLPCRIVERSGCLVQRGARGIQHSSTGGPGRKVAANRAGERMAEAPDSTPPSLRNRSVAAQVEIQTYTQGALAHGGGRVGEPEPALVRVGDSLLLSYRRASGSHRTGEQAKLHQTKRSYVLATIGEHRYSLQIVRRHPAICSQYFDRTMQQCTLVIGQKGLARPLPSCASTT